MGSRESGFVPVKNSDSHSALKEHERRRFGEREGDGVEKGAEAVRRDVGVSPDEPEGTTDEFGKDVLAAHIAAVHEQFDAKFVEDVQGASDGGNISVAVGKDSKEHGR